MRYVVSQEPLGQDAPANTVHLRLSRERLELTLYCRDGCPVANVEVSVEADAWKRTVTTDGEGKLGLSLPSPTPPQVTLRWTHDGAARVKTYYLERHDFDSDKGQARRLANAFFELPGLRKELEEELTASEGSTLVGAEEYRESLRRMIALLDETEAS